MASTSATARDSSPQASHSRDNFTVVAARDASGTVTPSGTLPTPPNSISPALGPRNLKGRFGDTTNTKLETFESNLDLKEGDRPRSPASCDSNGGITSILLAKHYLPDILLYQGPLAIRHIIGCLTTSVPGFAAIPPTKARRLVVAALEGRYGEGSGADECLKFEKVGWGRWAAHRRGQPGHQRRTPPPEQAGSPYPMSLPIPDKLARRKMGRRTRLHLSTPPGPGNLSSSYRSRDRDPRMEMECETDKMSLDGSFTSLSYSDASPDDDDLDMNVDGSGDVDNEDNSEDATDDEDWAAMGAAALRGASYPSSATMAVTDGRGISRSVGRAPIPIHRAMPDSPTGTKKASEARRLDVDETGNTSNAQERAAVEALLSLGTS